MQTKIPLALGEGHAVPEPRADVKWVQKFPNTRANEHKRQITTTSARVSSSLN